MEGPATCIQGANGPSGDQCFSSCARSPDHHSHSQFQRVRVGGKGEGRGLNDLRMAGANEEGVKQRAEGSPVVLSGVHPEASQRGEEDESELTPSPHPTIANTV